MTMAPQEQTPGDMTLVTTDPVLEVMSVKKFDWPECIEYIYLEGFPGKPSFDRKKGENGYHDDYVSHANAAKAGEKGPGAEGMLELVVGFSKAAPDIKWTVQNVFHVKMAKGDKYIIVSTASGTPEKEFFKIPSNGNGFHIMAIDVHYVLEEKVKESWHIEDFAAAGKQFSDKNGPKGVPPLHNGQAANFDVAVQKAPGKQITASEMPECLKTFYQNMLVNKDCKLETVEKILDEKYNTHPNGEAGVDGPGAKGQFENMENIVWTNFPDWVWETHGVLQVPLVNGDDLFLHIGTAAGSSDGKYFNLELAARKKFHIMAIDMHRVKNGKIMESWHIEDWASAKQQLEADGDPKLHSGQPPVNSLNAEVGME